MTTNEKIQQYESQLSNDDILKYWSEFWKDSFIYMLLNDEAKFVNKKIDALKDIVIPPQETLELSYVYWNVDNSINQEVIMPGGGGASGDKAGEVFQQNQKILDEYRDRLNELWCSFLEENLSADTTETQDDNPEYTGEDEQTEVCGNSRHAILRQEPAEPTKDVEVSDGNAPAGEDDPMKETKDLLDQLRNKMPSIPGLDAKALAEKFIEKDPKIQAVLQPYKDIIEQIEQQVGEYKNMTDEQLEAKKQKVKEDMEKQIMILVDQYTRIFQEYVDKIIAAYNELKTTVENLISGLPAAITSIGAGIAMPTSSAAAIGQAKSLLTQLSNDMAKLDGCCMTIASSATQIGFPLPSVVTGMMSSLSVVSGIIQTLKSIIP